PPFSGYRSPRGGSLLEPLILHREAGEGDHEVVEGATVPRAVEQKTQAKPVKGVRRPPPPPRCAWSPSPVSLRYTGEDLVNSASAWRPACPARRRGWRPGRIGR